MEYRLFSGRRGAGEVLNISSGGILFRTDQPLPPGPVLQARIPWPSILEDGSWLELVIQGQIVRSDGSVAALALTKHSFRRMEQP